MSMHTLATVVVALASSAALVAFDDTSAATEPPICPPCPEPIVHLLKEKPMSRYDTTFGDLIAGFTQRIADRWIAEPEIDLSDLDEHALHDIGLDASEIDSVEAESRGIAALTRRRIVAEVGHV